MNARAFIALYASLQQTREPNLVDDRKKREKSDRALRTAVLSTLKPADLGAVFDVTRSALS
jgi:hypothetical protein